MSRWKADALLRLIRDEAPAVEFDRVVAQARREGCPAAAIGELESNVAVALEARSVVMGHRRREEELAALYETAGDLSSLRDLEHVLRAIVRRSRQLLATDVAYLMLIDEQRGDTYMRVTEGTMTKAFDAIRLDLGVGLGGLVAQAAAPYWTHNYTEDTRFLHVIDDVVRAERLVAILGVPLRLGRRVIGVLFAADRHERPFSSEEVALLSSLAAHAAIAIDNASLFRDTQQALSELTAANRLIRAHNEALERAAELHERLTGLVLRGGGVLDVARAVAEVVNKNLVVLDPHGRVVASAAAGSPRPGAGPSRNDMSTASNLTPVVARRMLGDAQQTGRTMSVDLGTGPRCSVTPILAGPDLLGALLLTADGLSEAELRMLERGAQVTALLLLSQRSIAEAEQRVRGELITDIMSVPHRDIDGLRRRAQLLGVDLGSPYAVVVARPASAGERRAAAARAGDLAAERQGIAGEHQGDVVLLLPADEAGAAGGWTASRLGSAVASPVTVGAAGPAVGAVALAHAYSDAVRCVAVLIALGREGQATSPAELGLFGLLFSQAGRADVNDFVHRILDPVIDYDSERGTDLLDTLAAFFDCDRSVARTAERLYIHVNTLYQRFDRVSQLLGSGWRSGDDALQLHLALKLQRIGTDA